MRNKLVTDFFKLMLLLFLDMLTNRKRVSQLHWSLPCPKIRVQTEGTCWTTTYQNSFISASGFLSPI